MLRLIERKHLRDVRSDRSALHQCSDLLEVLHVVLHAEIDRAYASALRRLLVDLADQVDQHSAALEDAPGSRLRVSAERIEHHVDVAQLLLEAFASVVDDGIDSDRSKEIEAGLARGSCDLRVL